MGADYIVGKPFLGDGGRSYEPGERVDAEMWKNRDSLLAGRFLVKTEAASGRPRFAFIGKEFAHEGDTLASGTLVDLTGWRHVEALIASRFLIPATEEQVEAATTPPLVLEEGRLELAGATKEPKGRRR